MANVLTDIKQGDIFSEISHYTVVNKTTTGVELTHLESGEKVTLSNNYVQNLLVTADQYFSEVDVTKEDKKDGTPGIRTIWENIHSSEVFTVCFRKQDEAISATKLKALRETQINEAIVRIEQAQKSKKGVANIAKEVLAEIQANPISPIKEGDLRILRGYKIQYISRDGKYDCIDMNLVNGKDTSKAVRPVNINSLQWLVFKGVKYNVK